MFYDSKFEYFEEAKADRFADYIVLTIYILLLLFFIVTGVHISLKKNNFIPAEFLKEIGVTTVTTALVHFLFIRSILSGMILFLNSNLGTQNQVTIDGRITSKFQISGKGATNELKVLTASDDLYFFDVDRSEMSRYEIDSAFHKTMTIGCFGIIYK